MTFIEIEDMLTISIGFRSVVAPGYRTLLIMDWFATPDYIKFVYSIYSV